MSAVILNADARRIPIADGTAQCCVTSPPYYGLRDYGADGQIGLESTPDEYVAEMVAVFREVWRVLRDDGVAWLNLGDSYARGFGGGTPGAKSATNVGSFNGRAIGKVPEGFKGKDLLGIPWRVAFALQADGWYLRSDVIWAKPSPMPESVRDRPTKAHEYVFLLSKRDRYYYDADAVREDFADARMGNPNGGGQYSKGSGRNDHGALSTGVWDRGVELGGKNARTVWTINPNDPVRLRSDLTPEQRSYVVGELLRRGLL